MVFILLGAVKAAKTAKLEYEKDKKRNAMIVPVEGSHDMVADRGANSATAPAGADTWWGTARPRNCAVATPDDDTSADAHQHNPCAVGAWARERTRPSDGAVAPQSHLVNAKANSRYASSSSRSVHVRTPSQSSGSEVSAAHLALTQPQRPHITSSEAKQEDQCENEKTNESPSSITETTLDEFAIEEPSNVQVSQPRNRRRQSKAPALPEGSFNEQIRRRNTTGTAEGLQSSPGVNTRHHAATGAPSLDKVSKATEDDGSFAAAMRPPNRRHTRPVTIATTTAPSAPMAETVSAMPTNPVRKASRARPASHPPTQAQTRAANGVASTDGSIASAIPSTPLRKASSRARQQPAQARPEMEAQTEGSFAEVMRNESERPPRAKKEAPDDGSFAAVMRKGSAHANLRKMKEADAEGVAVSSKQTSAMAYPAGSKLRTRPGGHGAQGRSLGAAAASGTGGNGIDGEVQSCLRNEGSMKRRVTRR